jgi:hypothetical protein
MSSAISTVLRRMSSATSTVLRRMSSAISTVLRRMSSAISTVLRRMSSAIPTVLRRMSSAIPTVLRRRPLRHQVLPHSLEPCDCIILSFHAALSPALSILCSFRRPWRRGPRPDPLTTCRHLFAVSETSIRGSYSKKPRPAPKNPSK